MRRCQLRSSRASLKEESERRERPAHGGARDQRRGDAPGRTSTSWMWRACVPVSVPVCACTRARARAHVRARFCCVRPVCGVCVPARVRACLRLCLRACACVCACVRVCAASARTKSCACLKEARPPLDADKDADAYWEDEDGRIKKKMQVRARARACALVLLHRVVCCWVRVCCAPVRRHELCGRGSLSPPGGRPLRVCCVQGETRVCAARLLCRSGTECSDLQQKCTVQNRCSYCVEQCFLFQNSLV